MQKSADFTQAYAFYLILPLVLASWRVMVSMVGQTLLSEVVGHLDVEWSAPQMK